MRPMLWAVTASIGVALASAASANLSVPLATALPFFLLVVIVIAWRAGFRASLTVSLAATLSSDYFLTLPRHSLSVTSGGDVITLLTFAAVSVLVSQMSHRTRLRNDQLQRAEQQKTSLYDFSRSALLISWDQQVHEQLAELLLRSFRLSGVALFTSEEQRVFETADAHGATERIKASFRARRSYDAEGGKERLRVLEFASQPIGALLLRGNIDAALADSLATLTATHLVRTQAVQAQVRAQSEAFSERLRSAVLDGLAHTIKTPLTTILVSSSGLREVGPLSPLQDQLATTIGQQAEDLAAVTDQLLRTAALQAEKIRVQKAEVDVSSLVAQLAAELQPASEARRLRIVDEFQQPMVTDAQLLRLALQQIIENALKYSPAGSPVVVLVRRDEAILRLAIHNEGSFIRPEEHALIFERYYRASSTAHKASGTGVGLSAARNAIKALGGRIEIESTPSAGTTFVIELPEE